MSNVSPFPSRPAPSTVPDHASGPAQVGRAVYSVKEVSELLSVSLGTAYAWIRSGEVPAVKVGGRWMVPKGRFDQWLNSLADDAGHALDGTDPA